ncbi:hypothetical protein N1031_04215 [Herbiconiux moechotypicola]|uniref:Uncharacterized protein n=1 Tax=Herbiconiux moechotypicola TaxID=637393 RepID=A0ABN3DB02_9MICO|nr:hypothetical protein [Herbiconiux moechotypicola]MCS5728955.1 hypothetical protein [Herbiconiux moechotypicola]
MTASTEKLDDFRQEMFAAIALGELADRELAVVDDEGRAPVIVAMDDERLAVLLRRIEMVGGYANVFVKSAGGVRYLAVLRASGAVDPESATDMTSDAPNPATTVAMFLDYLLLQPNGVRLPNSLDRQTSEPPMVTRPEALGLVGA